MQWHCHDSNAAETSTARKVTFAESLKTFVEEIWFLMIFQAWFLKFSPSAHLRRAHKAPDIFAKHVQQAINETRAEDDRQREYENQTLQQKSPRKNDLLSNIINGGDIFHGSDKGGLSDDEITAPLHIHSRCHETTATTIQTALVLFAVHPELQQEIHEEVDVIYRGKSEGEGLVYESDYPKMRRVMALTLETLPLFPAISGIPKWTSDKHQIAHYNGQPFDIPPDTSIVLDVVAVHRNPRYWGEDANVFRRSRWLMDETNEPPSNSVSHSKHHLNMLCPREGAFIVFSDGHRNCLGKGFAQAEFCAVIATLLKDYSIELVPPRGRHHPMPYGARCVKIFLEERNGVVVDL